MAVPAGLDPDLLRAFVLIAEEGSFTRAARLVGRTQSAVSMQVQRLEGLLGQTLLERGRGGAVRPTAHGQRLLGEARDLLALHDRIWRGFRAPTVQDLFAPQRVEGPRMFAAQHIERARVSVALLAHRVELKPQRFGDPLPRRAAARAEQPAEQGAKSKSSKNEDDCGRVHAALLRWNEMRT